MNSAGPLTDSLDLEARGELELKCCSCRVGLNRSLNRLPPGLLQLELPQQTPLALDVAAAMVAAVDSMLARAAVASCSHAGATGIRFGVEDGAGDDAGGSGAGAAAGSGGGDGGSASTGS